MEFKGLTKKQAHMLLNSNSVWNFHSGATRSGKTFGTYYLLPIRINDIKGIEGQCVMIGKTLGTLDTNVIKPLRAMYGDEYVSKTYKDSTNRNYVKIFGREFLIVGADNVLSHNKIRGSSILYCYGDEVATWHPDMFHMLESRLDRPESKFDGTTNPDNPDHWLKEFFDKDGEDLDKNIIHYTIDDNTLLDEGFKRRLKAEYEGTVYYDRFILGKWVRGEGAIYKKFDTKRHVVDLSGINEQYLEIRVGVDYGETDATVYTAVGIKKGLRGIDVIDTYYHKNGASGRVEKNINEYVSDFMDFLFKLQQRFPRNYIQVKIDSANKSFIKLSQQRAAQERLRRIDIEAVNKTKENRSSKSAIQERVDTLNMMFIRDYLRIDSKCKELISAIQGAVYDDKGDRLDNKTVNVDSLDSFEYAWKDYINEINEYINYYMRGE